MTSVGWQRARGLALVAAMAAGVSGALPDAAAAPDMVLAQAPGIAGGTPSVVEVLRPSRALPAHFSTSLRNPIAFVEASSGEALVLDRASHTVYSLDAARTTVRRVLQIGVERGQVLNPGAFALGPQDLFAVADAPSGADRIQYFNLQGSRVGGFYLPDRAGPQLTIGSFALNGIGSMQFAGQTFYINLPARGSLVSEIDADGATLRQIGNLRPTGQESDRSLHAALNIGLPVIDPTGGIYFVFQTGTPMFRKYDATGALVYERHIEGVELDSQIQALPTMWRERAGREGQLPLTPPLVRAAAADRFGRLWVSLVEPYTYVYDPRGDKVKTVQFEAAGRLSPTSLFFASGDRLLVTPGCYEFTIR